MDWKDLAPETREWAEEIATTWSLEAHHERLLLAAGRAWDRAEEARALIADQGLVLYSKAGMARPHPAVGIENAAVITFGKLVAQLKLDGDGRTTVPIPGMRSHKKGVRLYGT